MMRLFIVLTSVVLSVSVATGAVYKKTNPDGSVIFTDKGSEDSKEVKVRKPTSFAPTHLSPKSYSRKKLSPSFNYELSINQPANDAVIVGESNVSVSVSVQPALNNEYNHKIRYQLGGQSIDSESTSVTFKDISRGTHNLSVSIVDTKGASVSSVASSSFHMKRFFKKPVVVKPKAKAATPNDI